MNKRLFVLAALVAVIWGVAFLWPEPEPEAPKDTGWPAYDLMKTREVELESGDAQKLRLERDSGEWFVRSGEGAAKCRADLAKVEALFNFISSNRPKRRMQDVPESEFPSFGLDNPKNVLTLKSDTDWRISVGGRNPAGDGVYARESKNPGQVVLLDSGYEKQLSYAPSHFYDLRLLDFKPEDVERVRVEGDHTWELTRKDQNMVFTWPQELTRFKAAQPEVNMYLHELVSTKGTAYDSGWSPQGAEPGVTISVWRKAAKTPVVLKLYKAAYRVDTSGSGNATQAAGTAVQSGTVAVSSWQTAPLGLGEQAWSKLAKSAFSLRLRSVISLDTGNLTRLEFNPAPGRGYLTLDANKKDKRWQSAAGDNLLGMDVMIWRLTDLKYEAAASPKLPEQARLALTWKLYGDGDKPVSVVNFYEDTGMPEGQCWVGVDGEGKFYPVDNELLLDLMAKLPAAAVNPASASPAGSNATAPVGRDLPPSVGGSAASAAPSTGEDNATHKE